MRPSLLLPGMLASLLICTLASEGAEIRFSEHNKGRPIDRRGLISTFNEEFRNPNVTAATGKGPWFASVHGGYGAAKFVTSSPFSWNGEHLTIEMKRYPEGWRSGIIQSVNAQGSGFSQLYGYFEMRASFPRGSGSWPAFWLKTVNEYRDKTETRAEIDVVEAYGADLDGHHQSIHLWPAARPRPGAIRKHEGKSNYTGLNGKSMFDGFHTYGVEVGPKETVFYFDDKELSRTRTLNEMKRPLFVLVSLALLPKEQHLAVGPKKMLVDWVRVWQRPQWKVN